MRRSRPATGTRPQNRAPDVNDRRAKQLGFNGDVKMLLALKMLCPLAEFPFAATPIAEELYSIGHGWYVEIGTGLLANDNDSDEVLRACQLIWSRDVAGAILVSKLVLPIADHGDVAVDELPSAEHLVPASGWAYRQLVKAGRGQIMEEAVYGSTGAFLFKQLRFPKVDVCFRSRNRKDSELPFAIVLR